jgi:preprotein translocase subunit SecF
MIPLGITNTWRIYQADRVAISSQLTAQNQQLEEIRTQLEQAKTDEQLEHLLAKMTPQGASPQVKNPQEVKNKLLSQMAQTQHQMKGQADTVDETKKQALIKNSLKSNLGALVAGTLFILIWHFTDWTRNA